MRISLNEIVDPYDGRVIVRPSEDGHIAAHFDLAGLPRVDHLLVGKPACEAVSIAEHLCGICPVAHHLAGVRALDVLVQQSNQCHTGHSSARSLPSKAGSSLAASELITPYADHVRRLLHDASHIDQHCVRFASIDSDAAIRLRRFARASMAASGSPGHFPTTAIPGGVRIDTDSQALIALIDQVPEAIADAEKLCERALDPHEQIACEQPLQGFTGADVALADANGQPDLLGDYVKAVDAQGREIFCEPVQRWPSLVKERIPGVAAPKPYLCVDGVDGLDRLDGQHYMSYRVGPIAQLSIGKIPTPRAEKFQQQWLHTSRQALGARAVVMLMCVELIERVCRQLMAGDSLPHECARESSPDSLSLRAGTATGLVDSPRGILEHTYTLQSDQRIASARILTPTAQNEPWLSQMLTAALERYGLKDPQAAVEESIREADPCLPISSAPRGTMGVHISLHSEKSDERERGLESIGAAERVRAEESLGAVDQADSEEVMLRKQIFRLADPSQEEQ